MSERRPSQKRRRVADAWLVPASFFLVLSVRHLWQALLIATFYGLSAHATKGS